MLRIEIPLKKKFTLFFWLFQTAMSQEVIRIPFKTADSILDIGKA
jgi:hypothetical protein